MREVGTSFTFFSVDMFIAACSYLARAVCVADCKCLLWAAVCISRGSDCVVNPTFQRCELNSVHLYQH